jgi:hypothetical protein
MFHFLAVSHLNRAVTSPDAVDNDAENQKSTKYSSLSARYCFVPVAVTTVGAPGDESLAFFGDLGQRIAAAITAEPRSFQFMTQRINVAVQRGNTACIFGTVPLAVDWDLCYVQIFFRTLLNSVLLFYVQKISNYLLLQMS